VQGAELLGMHRVGSDDATGGLEGVRDHDGIVVVLGDALADQDASFGSRAGLFVYLGAHQSEATRARTLRAPRDDARGAGGHVHQLRGPRAALLARAAAPGMARPAWLVLGALVATLTGGSAPRTAAAAFARLSDAVPAFGGMSYESLGQRGQRARVPAAAGG
jgi:hypothetical protein